MLLGAVVRLSVPTLLVRERIPITVAVEAHVPPSLRLTSTA